MDINMIVVKPKDKEGEAIPKPGIIFNNQIIKDMWSVIYNKNDNQIVHNHGSTGYSGLLYIEFNSKFHLPTTYVQPWNHIDLDVSVFNRVQVKEGTMIIVPSFINHFVPANTSNTPREIIAFDMRRQEEA